MTHPRDTRPDQGASGKVLGVLSQLRDAMETVEGHFPCEGYIYNPLVYAWPLIARYIGRYANHTHTILILGMNPGPWGMVQTGVPFGDVSAVRDWLRLDALIVPPARLHPKRPVWGLECPRGEVSGQRVWGWAQQRYGSPPRFFQDFFVYNYCPLAFFSPSGANITPDRLPHHFRRELESLCDSALRQMVEFLACRGILAVGGYAYKRAQVVFHDMGLPLQYVLHPSPANPKANRGWAEAMDAAVAALREKIESTEIRPRAACRLS